MKVVFLGTMGYYPTEKRHTNCVVIRDLNMILDAGTGFFRFPRFLVSNEINILLSHFHMDHVSGLTQLLGLFKGNRAKLYGPKGIQNCLDTIFDQPFFPVPISKHPFSIEAQEIGDGSFEINNGRVVTKVFDSHSCPVLGFRIETGSKIISFVTDTSACSDEVNFIRNSDLLIHECYYLNEHDERARKEMHTTTIRLAHLAREAECKRLALFHLNPSLETRLSDFEDEIKQVFPKVFIPRELMDIEI